MTDVWYIKVYFVFSAVETHYTCNLSRNNRIQRSRFKASSCLSESESLSSPLYLLLITSGVEPLIVLIWLILLDELNSDCFLVSSAQPNVKSHSDVSRTKIIVNDVVYIVWGIFCRIRHVPEIFKVWPLTWILPTNGLSEREWTGLEKLLQVVPRAWQGFQTC